VTGSTAEGALRGYAVLAITATARVAGRVVILWIGGTCACSCAPVADRAIAPNVVPRVQQGGRTCRSAAGVPRIHRESRVNNFHRTALAGVAALAALVLVASTAQAAPSSQDQSWMVSAHQGNLAEIAAGQAAVAQASTDTVRHLGQMLIDDHTTLDANLTAAATQLGVTLPGSPTPEQQAELASVASKTGAAFDTAWISSQIPAHKATLAAGATELATGSDPTVKGLASAAAPVVQHHLDELVAVAPDYGVPSSVSAGNGGQAARSAVPVGIALLAAGALALMLAAPSMLRRRGAASAP
jgi:putative membrane protein